MHGRQALQGQLEFGNSEHGDGWPVVIGQFRRPPHYRTTVALKAVSTGLSLGVVIWFKRPCLRVIWLDRRVGLRG